MTSGPSSYLVWIYDRHTLRCSAMCQNNEVYRCTRAHASHNLSSMLLVLYSDEMFVDVKSDYKCLSQDYFRTFCVSQEKMNTICKILYFPTVLDWVHVFFFTCYLNSFALALWPLMQFPYQSKHNSTLMHFYLQRLPHTPSCFMGNGHHHSMTLFWIFLPIASLCHCHLSTLRQCPPTHPSLSAWYITAG